MLFDDFVCGSPADVAHRRSVSHLGAEQVGGIGLPWRCMSRERFALVGWV
jgi:hypothetical protein